MSFADYLRGSTTSDFFNQIAAQRADRDADSAIASWKNCVNKWRRSYNQLKHDNDELAATTCMAIGMANARKDAIAELMASLRQIDPDHPLLADGVIKSIEDAGTAEYAASKGYIYDPETRTAREAT